MGNAARTDRPESDLVVLCHHCKKRLPLSGTLDMDGTFGVRCRRCGRTTQITVAIADDPPPGPASQ